MNVTFCSFYTPGYEKQARALAGTLHDLRLSFEIRPMPDCGTWVANCATKPIFIRSMMDLFPKEAIVWLDADARVLKMPSLFDNFANAGKFGPDFAAHWFKETELLSGTIYFAPNTKARELVANWIDMMNSRPGVWDQHVLQGAVDSTPDLKIERLPPEFCWMQEVDNLPDISSKYYGQRSPVIRHLQASRYLAKK